MLIGLLCCCTMNSIADNYIIKAMNVKEITIGVRNCHIGDTFSDKETIVWDSKKVEIIEAQNLETKEIWQFTKKRLQDSKKGVLETFCGWVKRTWGKFKNYYTNVSNLSTRYVETYSIDEALTREFNLIDSIKIDTRDDNIGKEYFVSYFLNGHKQTLSVPLENNSLIFHRGMFIYDGIKLPKKIVLTIYYKKDDLYYEITTGMCVTLVEQAIEDGDNFIYQ